MTSCALVGLTYQCKTCGRVFTVTCPEQLQTGITCACGAEHYGAIPKEARG